jgi:cytochrome c553
MKKLLLSALLCGGFAAGTVTLQAADDLKARAQANWKEHCTKCHGDDGAGKTAMGRKLKLRDYTDPKVQTELTDEKIFKATKEGVDKSGKNVMKAYAEDLTDEEIKDLIAHIRDFNKDKK